jgi:hypothetical protein
VKADEFTSNVGVERKEASNSTEVATVLFISQPPLQYSTSHDQLLLREHT